jgi:predicted metal-dependent phosphoesterase TrpH
LIDLHTHTNESDGSLSPGELISAAAGLGIRHLAVTDHDTFSGYLLAREAARDVGIHLLRGIELSTRDNGRPIHLLAYFPDNSIAEAFAQWLDALRVQRTSRNARLARKLEELNRPVTVAEAEELGKSITGRVHFARVMIRKGYVQSIQEAFRRYLGEDAPGYVEVDDPPVVDAIQRVRDAGGLPVVAHPGRYRLADELSFFKRLTASGLGGVEVVHSDHREREVERYGQVAAALRLVATGGSDFHGDFKPGIRLGHGDRGQMPIPADWIDSVRDAISRG